MTRYFKSHFWQAAAVALAATVVLMAACGGSAKRTSNAPAPGATGAETGDTGVAKSVDGSYNYSETADSSAPQAQSRDLAAAPSARRRYRRIVRKRRAEPPAIIARSQDRPDRDAHHRD